VDDLDTGCCPAEFTRVRTRLAQLLDGLEQFRADHRCAGTDEVLRFESMCRHMFQTFACPDAAEPVSASPVSNLDTGDAVARPFPPFVDALRAGAAGVTMDAHHYYGAESIAPLSAATTAFLHRTGFPTQRPPTRLRVLPGAGTVQVYDAVCKVVVRQPDDTVVVPRLGYGFFLTQPCRVGGRVAPVACDGRGAVTAQALTTAVNEQNHALWDGWRRDADTLFGRAVRRLSNCGVPAVSPQGRATLWQIKAMMAGHPAGWRSPEVWELLSGVAPQLAAPAVRERALALLRPPAVVAFLHIQPAVSGHVYSTAEVAQLAAVLDDARVAVVEDVAYHSIRCRLRDLASMQGVAAEVYTLLGLSKPMAVANLRLGLLLVDDEHYERPHRALEATTGYVSALLQRTLAHALAADGYDEYTAANSCGPQGYEYRRDLMHRLLGGGSRDDPGTVEFVRRAAAGDTELEPFVDAFLREGLRRWLRPVVTPVAGFFQLVSCAPLLDLPEFRALGIGSSFDVFALLAYLFDVRTIPEESMGPGADTGDTLRLAFSPDPEVLARLLLRTYRGLALVERAVTALPPLRDTTTEVRS